MRCDQFMGLNEWADNLLSSTFVDVLEKGTRTFPDGRVEEFEHTTKRDTKKSEVCGNYQGMFMDEYSLYRYIMPDGKIYEEFVQAEPWSSGPVFFLALKDEKGVIIEKSLWPVEMIENA